MMIQCCVCNRIEHDGVWRPADHIEYDVSHGYCPQCAESAAADILAFAKARRRTSPSSRKQPGPQSRWATRTDADSAF